jgi:hypothetical protein
MMSFRKPPANAFMKLEVAFAALARYGLRDAGVVVSRFPSPEVESATGEGRLPRNHRFLCYRLRNLCILLGTRRL